MSKGDMPRQKQVVTRLFQATKLTKINRVNRRELDHKLSGLIGVAGWRGVRKWLCVTVQPAFFGRNVALIALVLFIVYRRMTIRETGSFNFWCDHDSPP